MSITLISLGTVITGAVLSTMIIEKAEEDYKNAKTDAEVTEAKDRLQEAIDALVTVPRITSDITISTDNANNTDTTLYVHLLHLCLLFLDLLLHLLLHLFHYLLHLLLHSLYYNSLLLCLLLMDLLVI